MLGKGRPFIMELVDPHRSISQYIIYSTSLNEIQDQINSTHVDVKVLNLTKVNKEHFESLKEGEEAKLKAYVCICWVSKELKESDIERINSMENLILAQKTPIRVLHRRTLLVREKGVLKMKAYRINDHFLELRLITTAGTYVKEFIHSDLGRTEPNLGSILGCKADILQLDVLGLGYNSPDLELLLDNTYPL